MSQKISFVIPVYNEDHRISLCFNALDEFLENSPLSIEVVFVDDGSTDNTVLMIKDYIAKSRLNIRVLINKNNRGKGAVVRDGMLASTGEVVFFFDVDLSTPLSEVEKFLDLHLKFPKEVIIGSRALSKSKIKKHQPLYRRLLGKTINRLIQLFFLAGIKDTQCGFKLFPQETIGPIFQDAMVKGFLFDVEILIRTKKLSIPIREVPVVWENDDHSKMKPTLNNLGVFLKDFILIYRSK